MKKKVLFGLVILTIAVFAVVLSQALLRTRSKSKELAAAANVIVYTHSSFMDAYGPGPELKAAFEKVCGCTIEYFDAGGTNAAIEKLRMDPKRRVDLVLGIDHLLIQKMGENVKLQNLHPEKREWRSEVKKFVYPYFVPYDWSPMGFIYRADETKPAKSMKEALANLPKNSLSLQNPTLSTPGLEFIYWLFAISHDKAGETFQDLLQSLKGVAHSYSPSWSASYGLFKKGEAKVTFSYLTSLLYHWGEENNRNYQFMVFDEGHPAQFEYAAVPDSCWNCNVAKQFIDFMLSPEGQKILVKKNFMLPVTVDPIEAGVDPLYSQLPQVKILDEKKLDAFVKDREKLLEEWSKAR